MVEELNWEKFKIETPAKYRIRVQGEIDLIWYDMRIDLRYI